MNPNRVFSFAGALALAIACLLGQTEVGAATLYWDSNGTDVGAGTIPTGIWGTNSFWNSDSTGGSGGAFAINTTADDDLYFSAGSDAVGPTAVTLNGAQAAQSLTFNYGQITISGGTGITLGGTGTVTANQDARIDSQITASSGLIKEGTGTLVLSHQGNSISNAAINGGTLAVNRPQIGGSVLQGAVQVNMGATLRYDSNDGLDDATAVTITGGTMNLQSASEYIGSLTLNNGAQVLGDNAAWGGVGDWTGGQFLLVNGTDSKISATGTGNAITSRLALTSVWGGWTGSRAQEIEVGDSGSLAISGQIIDTAYRSAASVGGVLKTGTGTLVLSGSNTYTGGTAVNAGLLQLGNVNALGASTGGLTVAAAGTVDLQGNNVTVGSLSGADGAIIRDDGAAGTTTFTVDIASGSSTYAGRIVAGSRDIALVKNGVGTLVLSPTGTPGAGGGNAFNGGTTVNAGTLVLAGLGDYNNNLQGSLQINSGATVRHDSNGNITDTCTVGVNGGTLNLQSYNDYINTLTLSNGAQVSGSGTTEQFLIVNGSVGAKIIATGSGTAGTVSSTIAIASGYGIDGTNRTQEFDVASGATLAVSGAIVNNPWNSEARVGSLLKSGDGRLTLSGTNTYTGTTAVNAGTLLVNGSISGTGGDVTVADGATLGGSGSISRKLIVASGGNLAAGNSAGTLTVAGDLDFSGILQWELASLVDNASLGAVAGTDWDLIAMTGGALSGSNPTINLAGLAPSNDAFWKSSHVWDILTGIGSTTLDPTTGSVTGYTEGQYGYFGAQASGNASGGILQLTWTPIPEPGTLILLASGLIGLLAYAWRKRK